MTSSLWLKREALDALFGHAGDAGRVELEELREHHARRALVEFEHLGIEGVEAGGAAEEQLAAAVAVVRAEVEFLGLQAVQAVEALDRRSLRGSSRASPKLVLIQMLPVPSARRP